MSQMAIAFTFHLAGEENVAGRPAYVLIASPKPGYRPINRQAKVLIGMQGKMLIDKHEFHWAKVEAEVIHPVTFAGFLARVGPGTRFELEKEPVNGTLRGTIWQPKRFEVHVAASVLFWQRNSTTIDTFAITEAKPLQDGRWRAIRLRYRASGSGNPTGPAMRRWPAAGRDPPPAAARPVCCILVSAETALVSGEIVLSTEHGRISSCTLCCRHSSRGIDFNSSVLMQSGQVA